MTQTYPVAETFTSIQGEGIYTGTPMLFVRLAGCNVGKYATDRELLKPFTWYGRDHGMVMSGLNSICTALDGTRFVCDTNYHKALDMTPEELGDLLGNMRHVCLTGGEPYLHDLTPLIDGPFAKVTVHIETSGTLPIKDPTCWITCSPKWGLLRENSPLVDEWKFLVGPTTRLDAFEGIRRLPHQPVYLQPINPIGEGDLPATQHVIDVLLAKHPDWRLSMQMHKYLGLR